MAGIDIKPECHEIINDSKNYAFARLKAHDLTDEMAEKGVAVAHRQLFDHLGMCESPIEAMMLASLAFIFVEDLQCFPPAIHDTSSGDPWPARPIVIIPQFVIARYRLDFLVQANVAGKVLLWAIECDGNEHHSLSQDVWRDKARDHYLKNLGIETRRYTGTWIYRNRARGLASEIAALIESAAR